MSISILDYLLASLGEECGEVQQAIGKATRFGLLDVNIKNPTGPTNWVNLRHEVHDVVAVYELLCEEFDRVETLDRNLIEEKKRKVFKWLELAKNLGRLDSDSIKS